MLQSSRMNSAALKTERVILPTAVSMPPMATRSSPRKPGEVSNQYLGNASRILSFVTCVYESYYNVHCGESSSMILFCDMLFSVDPNSIYWNNQHMSFKFLIIIYLLPVLVVIYYYSNAMLGVHLQDFFCCDVIWVKYYL